MLARLNVVPLLAPRAVVPDLLDRPRERLLSQGAAHVDDAELLAVVLGTGVRGTNASALAARLLMQFGGLIGLARASPHALAETAGIGLAQAARIAAAIEIGTRTVVRERRLNGELGCAEDVHLRMWPRLAGFDQEVFFVLSIDACQIVIAEHEIARGHLTGVQIHPREIFHPLISSRAAAGVCVHNHPSGDPMPSAEDVLLTQRLKDIGELMGIPIVDHIIVTERGFTSLSEWSVGLERPATPVDPLRERKKAMLAAAPVRISPPAILHPPTAPPPASAPATGIAAPAFEPPTPVVRVVPHEGEEEIGS